MRDARLTDLIAAELRRQPHPSVVLLATQLAQRAGGAAAAVLYYGSTLRNESLDGVLDFYIVLDRVNAWPGSLLAALANRLLPPNVGYFEGEVGGRVMRAKFAVLSLAQFRRRVFGSSIDTTLWARFSQPTLCAFTRSPQDQEAVVDAVCEAVMTASRWAAGLGPERGGPLDYWRALYARTYEAELRVENATRGADLVAHDQERYARLLPLAWGASGIVFDTTLDGAFAPRLAPGARASAARRWAFRKTLGRPLNLLRLIKAAFTFDGAMDYVVWKVERQSGVKLEVREWQRRHPLLAAPGVYIRLRRRGLLR